MSLTATSWYWVLQMAGELIHVSVTATWIRKSWMLKRHNLNALQWLPYHCSLSTLSALSDCG